MPEIYQRANFFPGNGGVGGRGFVMGVERVTRAMRAGGGDYVCCTRLECK